MPALAVEEAADAPSPRTAWSVSNRKELATWERCHDTLHNDADALEMRVAPRASRLLLLGDSITESWRGTSYGRRVPRAAGVPEVLGSTLGARWPAPLALGISADCTQHLLLRMQHGELSAALKSDARLLVVLLIGTNNLGRGHSPEETVRGIMACAGHVLNATRGRLLVNALLPRGDRRKRGRKKGSGFVTDVRMVNHALNASVSDGLGSAFPGRARFVDCGEPFLLPHVRHQGADAGPAKEIVDRSLMPDPVSYTHLTLPTILLV